MGMRLGRAAAARAEAEFSLSAYQRKLLGAYRRIGDE
jgi:hypothetical protein